MSFHSRNHFPVVPGDMTAAKERERKKHLMLESGLVPFYLSTSKGAGHEVNDMIVSCSGLVIS